jgi:hypothetical protein
MFFRTLVYYHAFTCLSTVFFRLAKAHGYCPPAASIGALPRLQENFGGRPGERREDVVYCNILSILLLI